MANEKTILVIEDEEAVLKFLRSSLQEAGWEMLEATTARLGLDLAAKHKPDVILLDLGLPDQDGIDTLKALRQWSSAPLIIISARGQEKDKIKGLDAGADDYLTKPFGIKELMARIRAARRRTDRTPSDAEPVYVHEGLKVDLIAHRVWLRKKEVHLSPLQFNLLAALVRHAGRVVSHEQLRKDVWGEDSEVTPELIRITVHQLRHKIEADPVRPRSLKTESGVGYRLESPEEDA